MKTEEAIQRLETHKEYISPHGRFTKEAIDMAIKALEKQTPKKFLWDDDGNPVCPVCGEEVWNMEWCNNCGQKVDCELDIEIEDAKIIEKIEQAKKMYEDGAIAEAQGLLLNVVILIDSNSYIKRR